MQDFLQWWIVNVGLNFNDFIGNNLLAISSAIAIVVTAFSMFFFAKDLPFTPSLLFSILLGVVVGILWFWVIMFLPFVLVITGGITALIWFLWLIYTSVNRKYTE